MTTQSVERGPSTGSCIGTVRHPGKMEESTHGENQFAAGLERDGTKNGYGQGAVPLFIHVSRRIGNLLWLPGPVDHAMVRWNATN
jgi:hypothetical protein